MPGPSTTSWWPFPPQAREVRFDEKWAFVGKKQKHCDPDVAEDQRQGDHWGHVAIDPEHRLVVSVVPGKRGAARTHELVRDFKRRGGGRLMNLMTRDEYPVYTGAIRGAYATTVVPPRTGKPGRPQGPRQVLPEGLTYATVHKTRQKGRVVKVETRVVFGAVVAALAVSLVSEVVNTVFVGRRDGTGRDRNSRKVRKSYASSKDWGVHEAVSYFSICTYNFCWPVRALREGNRVEGYSPRAPAMAAGLTDHVWSLQEWLTFPRCPAQRTTRVA